jgi:hypothetical protein
MLTTEDAADGKGIPGVSSHFWWPVPSLEDGACASTSKVLSLRAQDQRFVMVCTKMSSSVEQWEFYWGL